MFNRKISFLINSEEVVCFAVVLDVSVNYLASSFSIISNWVFLICAVNLDGRHFADAIKICKIPFSPGIDGGEPDILSLELSTSCDIVKFWLEIFAPWTII